MKIIDAKNKIDKSGHLESQQFGIIFGPKMVGILSDKIYQNKIAAIIRELSSNAYDSHVENGNENKPFDVYLPTRDNPVFYIRDYGVGLSPDKIKNVYCYYGGSDRTDSNDYVGGMGLGSKTPFCYYTRTFNLDSWYDGVHRSYSAFINEEGLPEIVLNFENDSDEPSGVKVTVNIHSNDFIHFTDEAREIYQFYNVKPTFLGNHIVVTEPKYDIVSEDGKWKYDSENAGYNSMKVIMGQVVYSVDEFDGLNDVQKRVINSPFHLYMDIGEVNINPGRENLSYDNKTKIKIRSYINNIIQSFNENTQKSINKCATLWDARILFSELLHSDSQNFLDPLKITYNSKSLFDNFDCRIDFSDLIKDKQMSITLFKYDYWRKVKSNISYLFLGKDKTILFENDIKRGSIIRCQHICSEKKNSVFLFTFHDDSIKQEVYNRIGCVESDFQQISSVSVPNKINHSGRVSRGVLSKVVKLKEPNNRWSNARNSACWQNTTIDFNDTKNEYIYVEFNRYKYRDSINKEYYNPPYLQRPALCCKVVFNKYPTIYAIKTADLSKIKDKKNFIQFGEWLRNKILPIITKQNISTINDYCNIFDALNTFSEKAVNTIGKHCDEDTDFHKFYLLFKKYKDIYSKKENIKNYISICKYLKINPQDYYDKCSDKENDNIINIRDFEKDILNKYVLLKMIFEDYRIYSLYQRDPKIEYCKAVAEYINGCHNSK